MQHAIFAGLMFRHTLERLPLDLRALGEMLGCVDDVVTALREYQQEAQWRQGTDEVTGWYRRRQMRRCPRCKRRRRRAVKRRERR